MGLEILKRQIGLVVSWVKLVVPDLKRSLIGWFPPDGLGLGPLVEHGSGRFDTSLHLIDVVLVEMLGGCHGTLTPLTQLLAVIGLRLLGHLDVVQPIVLVDLGYHRLVVGEEDDLAVLAGVLSVAGGFRDLTLEDQLVVEVACEESSTPVGMDPRLVVVPEPDHRDGLFARKLHGDGVVLTFSEWC